MHVPPPMATNGSGMVQVALDVTLTLGAGDETIAAAAIVGLLIVPGIHPPLTHVPPPIEANGSGVVQERADDVNVGVVGVAEGAGAGVNVESAGIHPPLTQTPPPI